MNKLVSTWPFYMLIDAAKVDNELSELLGKASKYACLYRGDSEKKMAAVAPYIAVINKGSDLPQFVYEKGNQLAWGYLFHADAEFDVLVYHFRKFLMVDTEEGRQLYFRFYDPRVLRIFLPTCSESQLSEFFGPVDTFYCESEDLAYVDIFSLENRILKTEKITTEKLFEPYDGFELNEAVGEQPGQPANTTVSTPKPEEKGKGRRFVYGD